MLQGLGAPELLIILIILMLLFGAGRVASLGKELGTAISQFHKGLNDGKADTTQPTRAADEE